MSEIELEAKASMQLAQEAIDAYKKDLRMRCVQLAIHAKQIDAEHLPVLVVAKNYEKYILGELRD